MALVMRFPSLFAPLKGFIPDEARTAELLGQLLALGGIRIEPELVRLLCYHTAIVTHWQVTHNGKSTPERPHPASITDAVNRAGSRRKPTALESGGDGIETLRRGARTEAETPARINRHRPPDGVLWDERERGMRCAQQYPSHRLLRPVGSSSVPGVIQSKTLDK